MHLFCAAWWMRNPSRASAIPKKMRIKKEIMSPIISKTLNALLTNYPTM
jgi:hypothetical protein